MKIFTFFKKIVLGTILFIIKEVFSFIIKFSLFLILIVGVIGAILNTPLKMKQ